MPPNPLDIVNIGGIEIAFEDPCPCDSGHSLMRCCLLENGQVRKRPAKIKARTAISLLGRGSALNPPHRAHVPP